MFVFDECFRILFLFKVGLAAFHDHIGMVMVIDRVSEKDLLICTAEGLFEPTSDVAGCKVAGAGGEQQAVEAERSHQAQPGRCESRGTTCLHETHLHIEYR